MVQIAQQSSLHAMTSMLGHLSQNPQLLQQFSNSVASSSSSISAPSSRPTGNGKAKAKWGKGKAKMTITPSPLVLTQQPTLDTKKRGETVTVVPSVSYQNYSWDDVVEGGKRIASGELVPTSHA